MNNLNPTIGIIDSGIGGISILKQLINKYKCGNYIYFADNLYMPYGNKDKLWLNKRIEEIVNILKDKYKVDYIIIACNTASTCLDNGLEGVFKLKFEKNRTYFATNLTKQNLPNLNIISDETFASEIEENIYDYNKLKVIVKDKITLHKLNTYKEIVLACTHFELLKDIFQKMLPNTKILSNSSCLLESIDFNYNTNKTNVFIIMSKENQTLRNNIFKLLN